MKDKFRWRRRAADPAGDERDRRIAELVAAVPHGDPAQLAFQISEIGGDLIYERHGITVGPGDIVIDAGGNIGVSALHFALQSGAAEVHSFEPVPTTFEILSRNVAGTVACTAHPLGLAAAEGTAEITHFAGGDSVMSGLGADPDRLREKLALAGRNFGLSAAEAEAAAGERLEPRTSTCRLTTVSAFLRAQDLPRVDLLKIDVEGSELEVLRGIAEEDWPKIRQIAAEVHEDELLERITALLADRSFEVVTEQDPQLEGTPVRLLYATR